MASHLYVKLDASYADDPKIIEAGEQAELLYVRSLALCKRILTDGFVASVHLPRFGLSNVQRRADKLCDVGLWERVAGGYQIVAWLHHNKSAEQVAEIIEKRREAGKRGGRAKQLAKQSGRQGANQDAPQGAQQTRNPETETETETETLSEAEAKTLSLSPPPSTGGGGEELEAFLETRGFSQETISEAIRITERNALAGNIANPFAYAERIATNATEALVRADRTDQPVRADFDGEIYVHIHGRGWIREAEFDQEAAS